MGEGYTVNINQIKCKIIIRFVIVLCAIFITCLLSVIETGINIYKEITIVSSLVLVIICIMLCFKSKKQKP